MKEPLKQTQEQHQTWATNELSVQNNGHAVSSQIYEHWAIERNAHQKRPHKTKEGRKLQEAFDNRVAATRFKTLSISYEGPSVEKGMKQLSGLNSRNITAPQRTYRSQTKKERNF